MPKGTDDTWCEKLYAKCSKWNHFEKPRFGNIIKFILFYSYASERVLIECCQFLTRIYLDLSELA